MMDVSADRGIIVSRGTPRADCRPRRNRGCGTQPKQVVLSLKNNEDNKVSSDTVAEIVKAARRTGKDYLLPDNHSVVLQRPGLKLYW